MLLEIEFNRKFETGKIYILDIKEIKTEIEYDDVEKFDMKHFKCCFVSETKIHMHHNVDISNIDDFILKFYIQVILSSKEYKQFIRLKKYKTLI